MARKRSEAGEILRAELNYVRFPLFATNPKKIGSTDPFTATLFADDNGAPGRKLTVTPHPKLGLGGPFDHKAFRAVEKLLSERYRLHRPVPKELVLSPHAILSTMGLKFNPCPDDYRALRTFFERIVGLRLESDNAIEDRVQKRFLTLADPVPPIYEVVDWQKGRKIRLVLGDLYVSNLNARLVLLMDYGCYVAIQAALTRRLFELISHRAYDNRKSIYFTYSDLCERLPLVAGSYLSIVKKQLQQSVECLKEMSVLDAKAWMTEVTQRDSPEGPKAGIKITFVMHPHYYRQIDVTNQDKEDYEAPPDEAPYSY